MITRSRLRLTFVSILAIVSVGCLSGCEPEDKPSDAQIRAAIAANPELAQQLGRQLTASGVTLDGAGKSIRDNSRAVRTDVATQAPAIAPVVAPKLDAIDAGADQVLAQATQISQLHQVVGVLETNIRQIGEERDDFMARLGREQAARAADAAAHAAELDKTKELFTMRIWWMLASLAGISLAASVGLLVIGIIRGHMQTIIAAAALFVAGGLMSLIAQKLFWVGLGCALVALAAVAWAGWQWWTERQALTRDLGDARFRAELTGKNYEDANSKLVQAREKADRQVMELTQLVEAVKGNLSEQDRTRIFGQGAELGQLGSYLSDDTWELVDYIRNRTDFKRAERVLEVATIKPATA